MGGWCEKEIERERKDFTVLGENIEDISEEEKLESMVGMRGTLRSTCNVTGVVTLEIISPTLFRGRARGRDYDSTKS